MSDSSRIRPLDPTSLSSYWFVAETFVVSHTKGVFVLQSTIKEPQVGSIAQFWPPAWDASDYRFKEKFKLQATVSLGGEVNAEVYSFDSRAMVFGVELPRVYNQLVTWKELDGLNVAVLSSEMSIPEITAWSRGYRSASGK